MRNCETLARSSRARKSTAEIVTHVWGLQWPCLPMAHTWEPGNKWCGIKVWGEWKEWSDCTRHCGGGSWLRTPHRALPLAQKSPLLGQRHRLRNITSCCQLVYCTAAQTMNMLRELHDLDAWLDRWPSPGCDPCLPKDKAGGRVLQPDLGMHK